MPFSVCILVHMPSLFLIKSRSILSRVPGLELFARFVLNDLREKMFGSILGLGWIFISPAIYVLILWLVFSFGFRAVPVEGLPFVLWLVAGFWPWLFLVDALGTGTTSVLEKAFLLRKTAFPIHWIPLAKIASALLVHLLLGAVIVLILLLAPEIQFTWRFLLLAYFAAAACALVYGLVLLACALVVFVRDVQKMVEISLQLGFWLTPIFWHVSLLPDHLRWLFKLNPFFYIVEGYRACLLGDVVALPSWLWTGYFWMLTAGFVFLGRYVFGRLRPQFADVLR